MILSDDHETVQWEVENAPFEFNIPLNSDNNGPLTPGDSHHTRAITLTVYDAFHNYNPFTETVTLNTDDCAHVFATPECELFELVPVFLTATIDCYNDQGTVADGTNFIVTDIKRRSLQHRRTKAKICCGKRR